MWTNGQFRLDHIFDTQQAVDVTFLPLGPYLIVASETAGLYILTRDASGRFTTNVTLPLLGPVRVERVGDNTGSVIVVTNRQGPAQMFIFTDNTIVPVEITVSRLH